MAGSTTGRYGTPHHEDPVHVDGGPPQGVRWQADPDRRPVKGQGRKRRGSTTAVRTAGRYGREWRHSAESPARPYRPAPAPASALQLPLRPGCSVSAPE